MNVATNDIQQYTRAQNIKSKGCNSIMFFNQGDVTAVVNNVIKIRPGMSFSLSQVDPVIQDATLYQVRFDIADSLTTGTDQNLVVITTEILNNTSTSANGATQCNQH